MKKFLLSFAVLAASAFALGAETLTVANGTANNNFIPFNTPWWDTNDVTTQVIYPASMINDMEGAEISAIKFYVYGDIDAAASAKCQLSMGTTDQSAFVTSTAITGLTVVKSEFTGFEAGATEVEIEFDQPYVYEGGNLVFECKVIEKGTWKHNYFYGENQAEKVSMSTKGATSGLNFMPKTTFTYTVELQDYAATVDVNELNFGKANPDTEKEMTVTLKNKGANAFTPTISGLQAPFSTTYEAAELASKTSVVIPVKFAPTATGEYTGTMTIDCGDAGSFQVALSGNCVNEYEMTICDGTATNEYLPIYGTYCDTQGTLAQMLYPAEMLSDAMGAKITSIKFYNNTAFTKSLGTIELALKETTETAYTTESAIATPSNLVTELTTVSSIETATGDTGLTFELAEPFTYEGGNLAVQTLVTTAGGWAGTKFYGTNMDANTGYTQWNTYSGTSNHMSQFLPKMTIIYTKEAPVAETMTVAGTVTDQITGAPIEGVTVTLTVVEPAAEPTTLKAEAPTTYTATTDAQGAYAMEITPVEGATYNMTFEKDGYETVTNEDVAIDAPQNVSLTVNDVHTAINDLNSNNAVAVKYINAMGQVSNSPFKGVNIVVTSNADGTTTTTKVVK